MRFVKLGAVSLMTFGMTGSASAAENPTKTLTDIEAKWFEGYLSHDVAAIDKILAPD